MLKLSVVSIFKLGDLKDLERTVVSVRRQIIPPHEHILIVSGVNDERELRLTYDETHTKIFVNCDRSLYDAMNIGLNEASGQAIIFLNGGDEFVGNVATALIAEKYQPGCCLAMRAIQYYQDDCYIRPSLKRLKDLYVSPSHQSFVAPLPQARNFRFEESKSISADYHWMRELIGEYKVVVDKDIIARFELGGVSNLPSVKTIRIRNFEAGVKRALVEFIKFIFLLVCGKRLFYKLLLGYKSDRRFHK